MRITKALVTSPLVLCLQFGCGATTEQLRARAAFDLSCPQTQLMITPIDSRTQGVTGCGQKAVYVEQCKQGNQDCTWVANTVAAPAPAQAQWPPPSAPAPPPPTAPAPPQPAATAPPPAP